MNPDLLNVRPIALVTLGIAILVGVVLTALGVVAVYVARIYAEVVQRPIYVVREELPPAGVEAPSPVRSSRL